jgi:hypothetical protein
VTLVSSIAALAVVAMPTLVAPLFPSEAEQLRAYINENAQSYSAPAKVVTTPVSRDSFSATPGVATLIESGTNHDWAKLVLLYGNFPMSDNNVTVMTRWMRQENGPEDWFNRNNPLNNGWGSGGGGGTGTYANLDIAAQNAAEALRSNPGYSGIVAAFDADGSTSATEHAIWASPWATGHYAYGGHWSSAPVPVVKAPKSAW